METPPDNSLGGRNIPLRHSMPALNRAFEVIWDSIVVRGWIDHRTLCLNRLRDGVTAGEALPADDQYKRAMRIERRMAVSQALMGILYVMDFRTSVVAASVSQLAENAQLSLPRMRRALADLKRAGYISNLGRDRTGAERFRLRMNIPSRRAAARYRKADGGGFQFKFRIMRRQVCPFIYSLLGIDRVMTALRDWKSKIHLERKSKRGSAEFGTVLKGLARRKALKQGTGSPLSPPPLPSPHDEPQPKGKKKRRTGRTS